MSEKIIKSSAAQAVRRAVTWLRIGRAVLLLGASGIGKSWLVREQIATELARDHEGYDKLPILLDLRVACRDSVDFRGVPGIDRERHVTEWFQPGEFPTEGPGIIFIDEVTHATPSVAHVLYQLILERTLAEYVVPKDVYIVACGNRVQDGCGLRRLDAALRQRFALIEIEPSAQSWIDWAHGNGIVEELIAAAQHYPHLIEGWDGAVDEQQSTGRELHALSDAIREGVEDEDLLGFASDVLGETAAIQVAPFIRRYAGVILPATVFANPKTADLPEFEDFDAAVSIVIALAKLADDTNIGNACEYVDRLDDRYRALFLHSVPTLNGDNRATEPKEWDTWSCANQSLVTG